MAESIRDLLVRGGGRQSRLVSGDTGLTYKLPRSDEEDEESVADSIPSISEEQGEPTAELLYSVLQ
jgi:hypothetical protein